MAVLDRPKFCLWMSSVLPCDDPKWELMATAETRAELELKAKGMVRFAVRRRLHITEDGDPPRWKAKF